MELALQPVAEFAGPAQTLRFDDRACAVRPGEAALERQDSALGEPHFSPRGVHALGLQLRSEVNSELNFCPNFEGLVLGCIDADFCK